MLAAMWFAVGGVLGVIFGAAIALSFRAEVEDGLTTADAGRQP